MISKEALRERLCTFYDAGAVCEMLGITVETLLECFEEKFEDVYQRDLIDEEEDMKEHGEC